MTRQTFASCWLARRSVGAPCSRQTSADSWATAASRASCTDRECASGTSGACSPASTPGALAGARALSDTNARPGLQGWQPQDADVSTDEKRRPGAVAMRQNSAQKADLPVPSGAWSTARHLLREPKSLRMVRSSCARPTKSSHHSGVPASLLPTAQGQGREGTSAAENCPCSARSHACSPGASSQQRARGLSRSREAGLPLALRRTGLPPYDSGVAAGSSQSEGAIWFTEASSRSSLAASARSSARGAALSTSRAASKACRTAWPWPSESRAPPSSSRQTLLRGHLATRMR
mmetsp:Transcript_10885/g.23921  ORF Transcript_10885/g.23921 Transcript_10885/m.23921 type:complete len:292 (-) Transcript_10885:676-1551(-)